MALTLQPIRGCPQHSGETGTRLSSTIHRRLLSRFFLREGGRRYTGYYNGGHNFGVLAAKLNAISDLIMIPQLKKVKNSLEYIPYGGQLLEMIKNIRSIFRL